jgi:two-component system, chemotaxis family, protein-glutamate methylesterase/glutaminase
VSAVDPSPVRVIGIGASAGGLEPMLQVLAALPEDFPHALLVVLHVSARSHSLLAEILDRRCSLRVLAARDGMPIRAGHAYVAPPDRHLTMRGHVVALTSDPQENGVRPAVDPLLRSIAEALGPNAVGVVLSGALADGAFGARAIAVAGGRVLVQDPAEALVASMPRHAIEAVGASAEVLRAAQIATELARLGPPPEIAVRPLVGARI